jgi:hypothetical protein
LDEEYAVEKFPVIPATEPMFTIEPPPESLISGAQVWMPLSVAVTLISKIPFQASMSTSGNITRSFDPTMFISTCSPPAWSLIWATAASHWS